MGRRVSLPSGTNSPQNRSGAIEARPERGERGRPGRLVGETSGPGQCLGVLPPAPAALAVDLHGVHEFDSTRGEQRGGFALDLQSVAERIAARDVPGSAPPGEIPQRRTPRPDVDASRGVRVMRVGGSYGIRRRQPGP